MRIAWMLKGGWGFGLWMLDSDDVADYLDNACLSVDVSKLVYRED